MSELTTAARPYAKAIFEMAQEAGKLDEWSQQLTAMSAVMSAEGAEAYLENPRLSSDDKLALFVESASGTMTQDALNLLKVLAENDRFALLPQVSVLFDKLKSEAQGSVDATLASAQALSDEQQQVIADALQKRFGRKVNLVTSIDESLMGGAIIRVGDLVIDGSIQSRLKDMKAALSR